MSSTTFCTGSVFCDIMHSDMHPLAGIFLCPSGSIRTMVSTPISASLDVEAECKEALNIVAYLLYALDRPEWFKQYDEHEALLAKTFEKEVEALEQQQRRAHLQLIKGGKHEES